MQKSFFTTLGALILGAAASAVFMQTVAPQGPARAANSDIYKQLQLFGDVFDRVRSDYVEQPDDSKLIDSAISGMLTSLDPHSSYLNAKSFRDMQVQTRGEFGGLGIEVTMENGVEKAIRELNQSIGANLKGYVVDLRNNPGGLLDQAISVSDTFLDRGEIVSTRGRNAEETQRFNSRSGDLVNGVPIVVLMNGGSASASEIVAGALQDHKRAKIIGTRSFGKGSVQTIIPLGGSGAIRLTTARYYTPSGQSIQAKGITPDIVVEQNVPEDQKARTTLRGEASLRGHLKTEKGDEKSGSSAFVPKDKKDDKQLAYALDMLRGVEKKVENATDEKPSATK